MIRYGKDSDIMRKKRFLSLMLLCVFILSSGLGACTAKKVANNEDDTVRQESGVVDTAYTGGKLDMVTKNDFYVTFDDLERGTEYASENAETTFKYSYLSLVAKHTTFYIDASEDGYAIRYYRSENSVGTDPYIDLDVDGRITSDVFICQADYKMASDYNLSGGILQVIYRASGKAGIFWNPMSLDPQGNIIVNGSKVGAISKNRYTNIAVAVDVTSFTYQVYINGKSVITAMLDPKEMAGYSFSDVRIIQSGGNYSGGMYVDNIALYEGRYPVSVIPDEDTEIAVSEDFEALSAGGYTGSVLSVNYQASLNVRQSSDGNKFVSAQLSYTEAVISVPRGGIGSEDFIFSVDLYKGDNSAETILKAGYYEFVNVKADGAVFTGDELLFYIESSKWVNISVAVRQDGYAVFIDGILCGEVSTEIPDLEGASIVLRGAAGDEIKLDNIKLYRAFFPINYVGTMPEKTITLYSAENFDIMGGDCSVSVEEIDGYELVKISDIKQGKPMEIKLADTELGEGNPGSYNAIRMTFYCPQDYNYAFLCILDCGQQSGGWSYYSQYICLDEKGWLTITLDFSELAPSRTPDFSKIYAISFNNKGWAFPDNGGNYNSESWGNASETELEFYIYSIDFVKN